ncbi:hypothetical protein O1611_g10289 [Lasiodiplodia mahajangana]|uniref:Uncharacterized protein n=1 Tax=Lasiodiplodia mahajangana TaxID=1108764 RepID=A0ACC2J0M7_9PEZI|nr:hypothetical protein O1611_g10289 [Lasiodiplodia mahajangana]
MPSSQSQKKRRRARDLGDEQAIPPAEIGNANFDQRTTRLDRPHLDRRRNLMAAAPSIDSADSASLVSVSRTSSPSKQLGNMSLISDGFDEDKLLSPSFEIPADLRALIDKIERIGLGDGFLPASAKDELSSCGLNFPYYTFTPTSTDETVSWMSPAAAKNIVARAIRCELLHEDETSWNMEVHHHLLRRVCRPQGRAGLVDFMSCTTARIAPMWCPRGAPSKMVDFCFYINPAYDPEPDLARELESLRLQLPSCSINHTDYRPLWAFPIGPSVETKKEPTDWSKALLQLGTWQSSQLRAIASLERRQTLATSALAFTSTSQSPAQSLVQLPSNPLGFTYYPGIIVQGHEWYFLATAAGKDKPAVLSKLVIGSTDTELGVYKVATALEYLTVTAGWSGGLPPPGGAH